MPTVERHIRPAVLDDWDALRALLQGMGGLSEEEAQQRFAHLVRADDHYLPVAVDGPALVGCGWVQDYGPHLRSGDRTARLHDLFVAANRRREGIGAALFGAVKAWAEHRRVRYLQWQASPAAAPFYERLSYKGDPCPQPEYPFFEITFPVTAGHSHTF